MASICSKWSGAHLNMTGPNGTRLRYSGGYWWIHRTDGTVSRHTVRRSAWYKAKAIDENVAKGSSHTTP